MLCTAALVSVNLPETSNERGLSLVDPDGIAFDLDT